MKKTVKICIAWYHWTISNVSSKQQSFQLLQKTSQW